MACVMPTAGLTRHSPGCGAEAGPSHFNKLPLAFMNRLRKPYLLFLGEAQTRWEAKTALGVADW